MTKSFGKNSPVKYGHIYNVLRVLLALAIVISAFTFTYRVGHHNGRNEGIKEAITNINAFIPNCESEMSAVFTTGNNDNWQTTQVVSLRCHQQMVFAGEYVSGSVR